VVGCLGDMERQKRDRHNVTGQSKEIIRRLRFSYVETKLRIIGAVRSRRGEVECKPSELNERQNTDRLRRCGWPEKDIRRFSVGIDTGSLMFISQ
jgi:hypothetical protein